MAHKTLIDATAYEVVGGKTLIDGTAYTMRKGRALVDGTDRDISLCVRWDKYSCDTVTNYRYIEQSDFVQTEGWLESDSIEIKAGDNYRFSTASGYVATTNGQSAVSPYSYNSAELTGKYYVPVGGSVDVSHCYVYQFLAEAVTEESSEGTIYKRKYEVIKKATTEEIKEYNKGSTSYGEILAQNGDVPENGELLQGSVDGDYCVVNVPVLISGDKYTPVPFYYERIK